MLPKLKTNLEVEPAPEPAPVIDNRSKIAVGYFFLFTMIIAVIMVALMVFLDPLQFYHRSTWYTPVFSKEQRYQNPGLAKNFDYDTIIIGTSMTENFLPSEVNKSLGGTTMKLSIEGSTVEEHNKIASVALKTGKVKKVLWGLDYFSLKNADEQDLKTFPDYMYDDNFWNDYKYWFNASVYEQFGTSIKDMLTGKKNKDLEHLNNWSAAFSYTKKRVAKLYYEQRASEVYFGLNEENIEQLQQRFDTYIAPLIKEYPDVEFNFYYPPYSVMRQVAWYSSNPTRFNNQLEMRKWMFQQFDKYSNVRLYDFQAEPEWTFNLDLYKDLSHHSGQVNSWIAEAIGKDDVRFRVTSDNIDPLNKILITQATTAAMDKEGNVSSYDIQINGKSIVFTERSVQGDGELFLSAKEIASTLGATLTWDSSTKTATLANDSTTIKMTAGKNSANVDGNEAALENPLVLLAGTAMVPAQFVSEQFGWKTYVEMDGTTHRVLIQSK
ncbi:stalk domain-containing protein [Paenibacillus sp. BR2-3]|uniref:stalk domain-containing protein n=1 Tax=Paenibacillus sp. BR2-3 TaxID=3048494 RepID=UPI0039774EC4